MCTLTWLAEPEGYQVFFNRDEKRERKQAYPPAVHESQGVRAIYPVDGEAGGSWLGVNAHGVTLGMMNYYVTDAVTAAGRVSRGKLLLALLDLKSIAEVAKKMSETKLEDYAPFVLVAIESGTLLHTLTWNNHSVDASGIDSPGFLTTSSFESDKVAARRRECFVEFCDMHAPLNAAKLIEFHSSQSPEPGPHAICMERSDARTLSFSHVHVTPSAATFTYTEGPPCRHEPGESLVIERAAPIE